jgi:branched-chain amino acid transport system permease protein
MRKFVPPIVLGAAILLTFVPALGSAFRVEQLTRILIYVILAASLDLMVGYTGMVNLGHAAFFGLAAYTAALLADKAGISNVLIALPASLLVAAAASLLAGVLTVRLRGIYFIMATLAFTQIVYFLLNDSTWAGGSDGILVSVTMKAEIGGVTLLNLSDSRERFYVTLATATLVVLGLSRVVDSPFGRVLQGIRENDQRMRALGYPVSRFKLACFVIGGTLSGLAGYLYFTLTSFADPTLSYWLQSAQILVMTVLGGIGTLLGPAIGVALFTLFIDWASELTEHWKLYLGLAIVVAALFAPGGIWTGLERMIPAGLKAGGKISDARSD